MKTKKVPLKQFINRIISIIMMPEMGTLPGQLAFYMLLSLVPLVTAACYIANLFEFNYINVVTMFSQIIPGGTEYINPILQINSINIPMIILLIWMLYIASNGCNTLILVANEIYGIPQSGWIKRRIKALFMLLMLIVFVIILLVLFIYQTKFVSWIHTLDNGETIYGYIRYIRYPLSFIILFIFLRMFYKFSPDRMVGKKHVNVGTLITSIGWIVITQIYQNISHHMLSYERLYGSLAHVALLMVWLYFISYMFVVGLAVNCSREIEEENI